MSRRRYFTRWFKVANVAEVFREDAPDTILFTGSRVECHDWITIHRWDDAIEIYGSPLRPAEKDLLAVESMSFAVLGARRAEKLALRFKEAGYLVDGESELGCLIVRCS